MIEDFALIDWFSVTLIITFGLIGLFNGFVKEVFFCSRLDPIFINCLGLWTFSFSFCSGLR